MPSVETNRAGIVAMLERDGWQPVRHGEEHDVYRPPAKPGTAVVPRHRTLPPGVARSIAEAAGW